MLSRRPKIGSWSRIDSDFSALVHRFGARHAGIIRLPDVLATERIRLIRELLGQHGDALTGAIVTIKGNRVRFSRPAVRH